MGLYRFVAGPNQCLQCNTSQCGGCPAETSRTPEGLRTNSGLLQEVQVEGFICLATSDNHWGDHLSDTICSGDDLVKAVKPECLGPLSKSRE